MCPTVGASVPFERQGLQCLEKQTTYHEVKGEEGSFSLTEKPGTGDYQFQSYLLGASWPKNLFSLPSRVVLFREEDSERSVYKTERFQMKCSHVVGGLCLPTAQPGAWETSRKKRSLFDAHGQMYLEMFLALGLDQLIIVLFFLVYCPGMSFCLVSLVFIVCDWNAEIQKSAHWNSMLVQGSLNTRKARRPRSPLSLAASCPVLLQRMFPGLAIGT